MKYKSLLSLIGCTGILAGLIMACGIGKQGNQNNVSTSGNSESSVNKTSAPDVAKSGGDARADMLNAYQAIFNLPSYHTLTTGQEPDGTSSTISMDYTAPDSYDIKREGDPRPGSGNKKSEIISIGPDSWMKMGDQPWKKSPINLNSLKEMQKSWLNKINDANSDIKLVGTESLDGVPMNVYQLSYSMKDEDLDTTYKGSGKVWIGVTDKLPHKAEIESQDSGVKSSNLTTTYDYKTTAKIAPPM